jgi:GPH family glycoside/pentoside/hexuronide:cation symporter
MADSDAGAGIQGAAGRSRWRLHFGWGIGTLGAALLLNGFAALQAYYLTTVIGISAVTAATLLFIAKIWDWISNPLVGVLSDRTQSRWGRRRPYLLFGAVLSGLAFAAFFSLALTPMAQSATAIVIVLALVGTGYTLFNVPYMAMPSELVSDYTERTRMFQYRVFFIAIGTLIGAGASQRLAEVLGGGVEGYSRMGLILGGAIMLFMAWSFFGTAGGNVLPRSEVRVPFAEQVRLGWQNKPFIALLATKATQLFGLFTTSAMGIFVIKYVLGEENPGTWLLWFVVFSFAAQVLSMPVWQWITRRLEKQRTYMLATVIFSLVSLSWLLASPAEEFWFFCLRAALKGFAAAGLLLMGQSMLPDTIDYDYKRTGLRREGIYSGLYSVVEKVASAFAPSVLLLSYAWFGFDSRAPVQTAATIDGIRYCAAYLPCIYFGLSLIPLWFYRLTEKDLKQAV